MDNKVAQNSLRAWLNSTLQDIRFWIVFFFSIRLIGIFNAPLESAHNWRQSLTNMISRNFVENGVDMFHPVIDMAGAKSGIIGSEFPFFNLLVYLQSQIIGYHHWNGRMINLIVSSIGIYYFFKLIRRLINKEVAFVSTIILLCSVWFMFSRKIMPDTFSVSIMIIGLYYGYKYLLNGGKSSLVVFGLLIGLGMLCKIPALSLLSVLALVILKKGISRNRIVLLFTVSSFSFAIACIWYFYWVPHLVETYEFQLYFPKGILEGLNEISGLVPELLERFYFSAFHSFIAFACFIMGVILLIKNKEKWILIGSGIVFLVFAMFIVKTGKVFPNHSYYIIPFVPVMALIAGYFISQMNKKIGVPLLVLIVIESIGNQQNDLFVKSEEKYKLTLENVMDQLVPKNELIVINGGQSPQLIYFTNRKGWSIDSEELGDYESRTEQIEEGAQYLVVNKVYSDYQETRYSKIYEDEFFAVHKFK